MDKSALPEMKTLPLWTALLPFLSIHVSYMIAAWYGHVPWCNPYWDSCSSISAAGRQSPEFFWFKITMVPSAILMILYWRRVSVWIEALSGKGHYIRWTGSIAVVFLLLYVMALGIEGDLFRLQRRIGVILSFTLTYFAQLLTVSHLWRMGQRSIPIRAMLTISVGLLLIGLTSLFIDLITDWHDDVEDAFEWNLSLLLHLYFLVSYWAWIATGFNGYTLAGPSRSR